MIRPRSAGRRWRRGAAGCCALALVLAGQGGAVPATSIAADPAADPGPPVAGVPRLSAATWAAIGAAARAQVAAESPDAAFPFATARSGSGGPLIVAHYFPPFPLSIGGKAGADDYYARNYLRPEGEGGKFARQGGFLRDRPLPGHSDAPDRAAADLAVEVARAARIGIDAFGVDLLGIGQGKTWTAALTLLDAARAVSPTFRIIPEPDMTANRDIPLARLADGLMVFARHPASYRIPDGRMLVMPFGAETRPPAFWEALIGEMAARGQPIAFAPVFLSPRGIRADASLAWAAGIWGDRDADAGNRARTIQAAAASAGLSRWIAPVAPQDYRPKSSTFWEARNSEALRSQWTAAIAGGSRIIHLITWNDYSESSHFAPSAFTQFLFYDLSAYYIAWAKRGTPPPILRDALYYVQRRQVLDPAATATGLPLRRQGGVPLANDVELVALLRAPGRLRLSSGGQMVSRDAAAGLQSVRISAAPGKPGFALLRGGRTVLAGQGAWAIDPAPFRKDATYGGGSTTRPIVPAPGLSGTP